MKKITLLAAFFVAFTMNAQVTIWEDSFETYPDFEIATIGGWTQIDNDAGATYGSVDYDFTNEAYIGTGIVFNPSMATPDPAGTQTENADQNPNWVARTGDKGMYMFASTSLLNDDYLITPQVDLTAATASSLSFWAKSITDAFGLERFEVLLSTTGTAQADFTENISNGELQAPIGDYFEYSFDISAYDGQQVYIAIHYVAQDSFLLLMDDFKVVDGTLGVASNSFNNFNYFVNANNQLNLSANTAMESLVVYNVLGQQVVSEKLSNTNEIVNISALNAGLYIATVSVDGNTKSFKIVKK
tara:strand:+ start:567 stop:1469 length:903 start_codon:yes stop_codon:yes gene_type:complete